MLFLKLKKSSSKESKRVYLSLGSNSGERETILRKAFKELFTHFISLECSSLYETDPQDFTDQPLFLNAVVQGVTSLPPEELLIHLQDIEKKAGRVRNSDQPKGPRTLDLDILLYGNISLHTSHLTIPHKAMENRAFVLIPLLETMDQSKDIRADYYRTLLTTLPDQGVYCLDRTL